MVFEFPIVYLCPASILFLWLGILIGVIIGYIITKELIGEKSKTTASLK